MRTSSKQIQKRRPTCTICMERSSNCSINGCSHQFCLRCIKRWSRTKNTCPLCRERFIRIRHKNNVIQVENIPERTRPERIPFRSQQTQQHGLLYLPMLLYPQNACIIYTAQPNIFLQSGVGSQQPITFSIGNPTFFLPVV